MSQNNKRILELSKRQGNNKCADCNCAEPLWASFNLGVFLCEICAGVHRSLGSHISKIKSLKLDNWDNDQVRFMEAEGNVKARSKYEYQVPYCYRKPEKGDPHVMLEQWIRAKYERHEFMEAEKQQYLCGHKEGYLWKRGRDDKKYNRRKFILDESANELRYYVREAGDKPKAILRIDELNMAIVPQKVDHHNGFQITFEKDGGTRNLFGYAEEGEALIEWYTAIRSAKLNRLRIAYPGAPERELCENLTRDFVKEGWLSKTGPSKGDAFRRRWFTLDKRKLMYYEDPLDAFPKGEIFIGPEDKGYKAEEGLPIEIKDPGCGFTLKTPTRNFHFSAETDRDQKDWVDLIRRVIRTPLSPQETASLTQGHRKRSTLPF